MKYIQYCVMTSITLTHKFSEVQSCVLTLQTYMEQRSNDTTKLASMVLEIEKHLKIVNASEPVQRTIDSYFVS
jgi:uncharacterized protein YfkK (UPF0435 family)